MPRIPRFPLTPIIEGPVTRLLRSDGLYALIDTEDLSRVMAHSWRLEDKRGCRYLVTGKAHIQMARIVVDVPAGHIPDHRNGDGLDNRKQNLRIGTQQNNRWNARKHRRPCTSRFKGVRLHQGKYLARICRNGQEQHLGSFTNEIDAARAYDAKAKELYGEFAWLNFPDEEAA